MLLMRSMRFIHSSRIAALRLAGNRWLETDAKCLFSSMDFEAEEEKLIRSVVGAFFASYNKLGYGFVEKVYGLALERELIKRLHVVTREVPVEIWYDGIVLTSLRLDMVVDGRLIVELKSSEKLHFTATRQVYNYLKATRLEVGLLLHYGPLPHFWRINRRPATSDVEHVSHEEHE
jgi:GxxExxY protein